MNNDAENYYKKAQELIKQQNFEDALAVLDQSISATPNADAYHDKGVILFMHGKIEPAIKSFKDALQVDGNYHQAYANLGKIMHNAGEAALALEYMIEAANRAPDNLVYKDNLVALLSTMGFRAIFNEDIKSLILTLFETKHINHEDLIQPWFSIIQLDPTLEDICTLLKTQDYQSFSSALETLPSLNAFSEKLFVLGVQNIIVPSISFERLLTHCRRYALEHPESFKAAQPFITALATYSFHNEFIFHVSEDEELKLAELKKNIESADEGALNEMRPLLALYACYAPLFRLENMQKVKEALEKAPVYEPLVDCHIDEPLEELRLRETIPPITPIDNQTSQNVRAQYEEFPYPRWRTMGHTYQAGLNFECPVNQILVAGGGTGKETLEFALAFPDAEIQCIDLSLSSLSYAKRKAQELGIKNVTFNQADILELPGRHDVQYDIITSSGVLQCMDEPERGWRVLTDLLKTGGYMHIALYSETARADVVEARRIIAEQHYSHDAEGMRAFRADCKNIMDKKYYDSLMEFRDYFAMSECRDLIFHVKEHRHHIHQIQKLLADHGLDFVKFNFRNPNIMPLYQQAYPDDPQGLNLDHWNAFEQANPRTFVEMYDFWSRKPA